MKNLLLLLLLANILYFLWGMFVPEERQPGTAIVEEADLGPSLEVTTDRAANDVSDLGTALGSGGLSELRAIVGRSCVTIGPLKERTEADTAVLAYSSEGMKSSLRSRQAEVFVGHWVQIRNVKNNSTAKKMLAKLGEGGLTDAYVVRTDDEGLKISLTSTGRRRLNCRRDRWTYRRTSSRGPRTVPCSMSTSHYRRVTVPVRLSRNTVKTRCCCETPRHVRNSLRTRRLSERSEKPIMRAPRVMDGV
jgi:hypothetical protein